jgi:hypothetical protein
MDQVLYIKSYFYTTLLCCQNCSKKSHFGQKLIKSIYFGSDESPQYGLHMESIKSDGTSRNKNGNI